MNFFIHWVLGAFAFIIAAYFLPGVTNSGFMSALGAALVLGFVNVFIRPLVALLTLPMNILTFGFFSFAINALLILLVSALVPGFEVHGFWWALLFSMVITFVSTVLRWSFLDVK